MVARIVAGRRSVSEIGFWVTEPGKSALTATAADDLLIAPTIKNAQVMLAGSVVFPDTSPITVTYPFPALTFVPIVFAKLLESANDYRVPFYRFGADTSRVAARATTTNVRLEPAIAGTVLFLVIRNSI